jgi:hypothetical protein
MTFYENVPLPRDIMWLLLAVADERHADLTTGLEDNYAAAGR